MRVKKKVRRLYEIANVLCSLELIEKTHLPGRKAAFRWKHVFSAEASASPHIYDHPLSQTPVTFDDPGAYLRDRARHIMQARVPSPRVLASAGAAAGTGGGAHAASKPHAGEGAPSERHPRVAGLGSVALHVVRDAAKWYPARPAPLHVARGIGILLPDNTLPEKLVFCFQATSASTAHALDIVLLTAPRAGRSYAVFPDGFDLHLLQVVRALL